MILTNLGNGNIDCGQCLLNYDPRDLEFRVVSETEPASLTGTIPPNGYVSITPPGRPPWAVTMGSRNFSRSATVKGINSPDVVVSTILVFPMGPNDGHAFVNQKHTL